VPVFGLSSPAGTWDAGPAACRDAAPPEAVIPSRGLEHPGPPINSPTKTAMTPTTKAREEQCHLGKINMGKTYLKTAP